MAFSGRCSFLGTQLTVAPSALAPRRAACVMPIEAAYKNKLKKYGPGKHWEHYELSKNGKAIRIKMHVKKGDTVVVVSGGDKGKVSTITNVEPKTGLIKCEGINLRSKYVKPTSDQERAELKKIEAPFHHSNVMHYSKAQETRSRVGHKVVEVPGRDKPVKVRFLIKTGEVIDALPQVPQ